MIFRQASAGFLALTLAVGALASAPAPARAEQGFTGLHIQGMDSLFANALGMNATLGVLVRDIALGGPADKAGFQRGDLIVAFDGVPVKTVSNLAGMAGKTKPGGNHVITVRRADGVETHLAINMGSWPAAWRVKDEEIGVLFDHGLTMTTLTQQMRNNLGLTWGSYGVGVTLVDDPSDPGFKTDLRRGEVIVQVNQKDVWLPDQVIKAYDTAKAEGRKALMLLVSGVSGFRFAVLTIQSQ